MRPGTFAATSGTVLTGVTTVNADTAFDASGNVNSFNGMFGWPQDQADHTLLLTCMPSPVPDPETLILTAGVGLAR